MVGMIKKKVFNASTIPTGNSVYGNSILISTTGSITFSSLLSKIFKGKGVNFIQDEEKPEEWYIEQSSDPNALKLRDEKNGQYKIGCMFLAKEILNSCKLTPDTSVRMYVSTELVEKTLYPIITKSAKESKVKDKK